MSIFAALSIYIIGIWVAYFQLQIWKGGEAITKKDYDTFFMLSTLSWLIYPFYGLVWLMDQMMEE